MKTPTLLIALSAATLMACDLNEGPGEELNEAVDDLVDGQPLREVGDEAGDIVDGQNEAERRLDAVQDWLAERRAEIRDGSRQADGDVARALDDLEGRLRTARKDVAEAGEDLGDDIEATIDSIEADVDALMEGENQ